jgi:folate-binding protein YgfZ
MEQNHDRHCAALPGRGVVEVAGPDRQTFLQGLVSNDVTEAAPGRAVWAALLTPQGKYLADFFIFDGGDRLLLDCRRDVVASLVQRLGRYRLRAAVTVADRSDYWQVFAAWGDGPPSLPDGALRAPDPRLAQAGWRILATGEIPTDADAGDYDAHRLALGLPDGPPDLEPERTVLMEAGFDPLNGISWTKGCYMGQELTARTRYRGLIKRRLVPVELRSGTLPPPGAGIRQAGEIVGEMRSGRGLRGLALIRNEAVTKSDPLVSEGAELIVIIPPWMSTE